MKINIFAALIINLLFTNLAYPYNVSTDFVSRSGSNLVAGTGSETIHLRGINFSNDRIVAPGVSDWITGGTCAQLSAYPVTTEVTNWYSEKHFQSIANIGFNAIRVNLHYRIFESDSSPGNGSESSYKSTAWAFIDRYIQWAKNHNLYLILDLHAPQGGYQPSSGGGSCLWDTSSNQTRMINLWKAIARRYANEPTIAAYDLLNEPTPTGPSLSNATGKYQTLMQQVVNAIRAVDTNHLIIVERVNWIFNANGSSPLSSFSKSLLNSFQVSVTDSSNKTIYDYHFYDPNQYALQNEAPHPNDGNYPDTNVTETAKDGSTFPRNSAYLDHEMDLENRQGTPMFVGEWGSNTSTLTAAKGGLTYSQDVMNLFAQKGSHWTYYSMFNLYDVQCCTSGTTVCCSGDNRTTAANSTLISMFFNYFQNNSAPTSPTGFKGIVNGSRVVLSWDGVTGAAGYKINWGHSTGNYPNSPDVGNRTSVTDANVPDDRYYLAISAYNSGGESGYSNELALAIVANNTSPTGFKATVNGNRVVLSWNGVTGAAGYKINWGYSTGNYPNSPDVGNTTSITATNVPDDRYYLTVSEYNSEGESGYSNELVLNIVANSASRQAVKSQGK